MQRKLITIGCLLLFSAAANAEEWRQFRGPGGQGASAATGLPSKWNDSENLAWRIKLPGYGASSPVTIGDRLYLTCYSGYGLDRNDPGAMEDLKLHVVCVSSSDGSIQWNTTLEPRLPESKRVRDHGYAAATPATDGETLYVFFGQSGVFAFDLNGKQKWQADVGSGTHGWGCGTSPVLFDDLVIVNASVESKSLVALNKKTGEEAWRASGMQQSWNTPHLAKTKSG